MVRRNVLIWDTKIEIRGENCRVIIGPGTRMWGGSITVAGNNAELVIGDRCQLRHARLVVEDTGSRMQIGAETTMTGATLVAQEGCSVVIGRDCMIAKDTEVRNSDSHHIYGEAEDVPINLGRNTVIGDHVWLGVGVFVFKGASVGGGTIVGANSQVRGQLPAGCLAYGAPARVQREKIRWTRARKR